MTSTLCNPQNSPFSRPPVDATDATNREKGFDKRYVIGMVVHPGVHQEAKCFDIFVATHRRLRDSEAAEVHKYDSSTSTWSLYGKESFPTEPYAFRSRYLCEFAGVVFHDNRFLMVVSTFDHLSYIEKMDYEIKYRYHEIDSSWSSLPGDLPSAGKMAPLLFDYKGKLMLVAFGQGNCDRSCSLWEYKDDKFEWNLVHQFATVHDSQNTGVVESRGLDSDSDEDDFYCACATYYYAHVVGDFLYFGHAEFRENASRRRHYRMKYSLITHESMPLDEDEVKNIFVECEPRPQNSSDVKKMFRRDRDHRLLFSLLDTASAGT